MYSPNVEDDEEGMVKDEVKKLVSEEAAYTDVLGAIIREAKEDLKKCIACTWNDRGSQEWYLLCTAVDYLFNEEGLEAVLGRVGLFDGKININYLRTEAIKETVRCNHGWDSIRVQNKIFTVLNDLGAKTNFKGMEEEDGEF